ncbi:MAG: phosphoribosyltransferase family protein [Calditrichia bacterium]
MIESKKTSRPHVNFLKSRLEGILQLFYPPVCLVCGSVFNEETDFRHLCAACLDKCRPVAGETVHRMVTARLSTSYLDKIFVCLEFEETVQNVIHHIKYRKMNRLAEQFSCRAFSYLEEKDELQQADLCIPVPLHPRREKERGYNQSDHVAEGFFSSRIPIFKQGILRQKATVSQTNLDREARMQNVAEAFVVREPDQVKGKKIVLVDDVVTTGATLNECARELKKSGAAAVFALTLATPLSKEFSV